MGVVEEVADSVLLAVATIPEGNVTTYGTIARLVGRGPRIVARVLATRGGEVPWWRVVRADGTIAPQLVERASVLLGEEGVTVHAGRIDLRRFGVDLDDDRSGVGSHRFEARCPVRVMSSEVRPL